MADTLVWVWEVSNPIVYQLFPRPLPTAQCTLDFSIIKPVSGHPGNPSGTLLKAVVSVSQMDSVCQGLVVRLTLQFSAHVDS